MMTEGGAGAALLTVLPPVDIALVLEEAYLLTGPPLHVNAAQLNAALLSDLQLLEVFHPVVAVVFLVAHLHAARMRINGVLLSPELPLKYAGLSSEEVHHGDPL